MFEDYLLMDNGQNLMLELKEEKKDGWSSKKKCGLSLNKIKQLKPLNKRN